jgi:hypothetical protein
MASHRGWLVTIPIMVNQRIGGFIDHMGKLAGDHCM